MVKVNPEGNLVILSSHLIKHMKLRLVTYHLKEEKEK